MCCGLTQKLVLELRLNYYGKNGPTEDLPFTCVSEGENKDCFNRQVANTTARAIL